MNNNHLYNGVASHLGNPDEGLSSGDVLSGVAIWGNFYAARADFESSRKSYGFDTTDKGAIVALEKEIIDDVKVGIGFQYDQADVNAHIRDINAKTKGGFVYAEYSPDNWFINATFSYGHADYSEKKHPHHEDYVARYDVDTYGVQSLVGYHFVENLMIVTPQAGLRYNLMKRESYTDETGMTLNQTDIDILTAVAGVKVKSRNCGSLKPEAHANLTYDIVSDSLPI
jgi:outer membrane autotransporter protein